MFQCSLDGNQVGLVFVETKAWLLRVRFSRGISAYSFVEGIELLHTFVRRPSALNSTSFTATRALHERPPATDATPTRPSLTTTSTLSNPLPRSRTYAPSAASTSTPGAGLVRRPGSPSPAKVSTSWSPTA